MLSRKILSKLVATTFFVLSANAYSGIIIQEYASGVATPDDLGGFQLKAFDNNNTGTGTTNTVSLPSPFTGELQFKKKGGVDDLQMNEKRADDLSWWQGAAEDGNYDVYTTGVNWLEILLPENTRAIWFNVGATSRESSQNNAWVEAYDGAGTKYGRDYFNVSRTNTPGFGIHTEVNDNGECGSISKVIIEPFEWGVGNFSIYQGSCSSEVPEPNSVALLALGIAGLLVLRRRQRA